METSNMEDYLKDDKGKGCSRPKGFFSKLSRPKKVFILILIIILALLAAAGIALAVIYNKGKASLKAVDNPKIDKLALEEAKSVYFNGKEYVYNEDLINILLIGTDSRLTVSQRREHPPKNAPMGDMLILVTINTKNKEVSAIAINRYSMAEIDMYVASDRIYVGSYEGQISIQYGWGDGLEESCELQTNAVSRMLYNIPINGYASLALPAIRNLNNVVGGIELVALDNIPRTGNYPEDEKDYNIGDSLENVKGKTIRLTDDQAYAYLRYRNVNEFASGDVRLERQKQYLKAYISKVKEMTKKEILFPLKLWDAISDYFVTDIDNYELLYLTSTLLGYKIDMDNIEKLPGTLKIGETVGNLTVEEYHLDEDALKEMVIKKFYKEAR